MTYGIVAIILLVLALVWLIVSGRSGRLIDEIEATIKAGDDAQFSSLLKKNGQEVTSLNDVTYLLLRAVMHNRYGMVQEILDLGHKASDLQRCALDHEVNLLSLAISEADADVLRILLAAGMKDEVEVSSPLLNCYVHGKPEHLRVLQMFDATQILPAQNERGYTPLHVAAIKFSRNPEGVLSMIRPLLENGADVNAVTVVGNTPLDMALDETHEGAGKTEALVELLKEYGGRTGRSLRVPQPSYTGRVYFAKELPQLLTDALPCGVEVRYMDAPAQDGVPSRAQMEVYAVSEKDVEKLLSHQAYVEVCVKGQAGEDPLQVAARALSVLVKLASMPDIVGVQFEQAVIVSEDYKLCDEDSFNPLLYTTLHFGQYKDEFVMVDTAGLSRFGLPEVELIVNCKTLAKNKKIGLARLVADLSSVAIMGTSAWEPGHTATLCGLFCKIGYGKHSVTEKEGFVFMIAPS